MESKEVWTPLKYNGEDLGEFYLVSNKGEIIGRKTNKIRKKNINHEGYYFVSVTLGKREAYKCIKVHKAVAESFLDNPDRLPVVNHLDGNKLNNNVENLEWCTYQKNMQHAIQIGLFDPKAAPNKHKIVQIETNKIYSSVSQAARELSTILKKDIEAVRKNISRSVNNKDSTAYGFHYKFL